MYIRTDISRLDEILTVIILAYSELAVCGGVEGFAVTVTSTACWDDRGFVLTTLLEPQRCRTC